MNLSEAGKRRAKAEKERSAATAALTKAVRQADKRGMTPTQIAKEAGVSRQTIHTMLKSATIALVLAAALAIGCGGTTAEVTGAALADCLRTQSAIESVSTKSADLDTVADAAGDTGLYVTWSGNAANVAVERGADDAANTEQTYQAFGDGFDINVDQLLSRDGNVVALYDKQPSETERESLKECL